MSVSMSSIRRHLADGSYGGGRRMEAACVRALEAIRLLEQRAASVIAELDDMTLPGVVAATVDDEDSLVIALQTITKHSQAS